MDIKELFNRALFLISVPTCVSCKERLDYEDRCFCPDCYEKYIDHKKLNCSRCARVLEECSCTATYLNNHYVKQLAKVFRYKPSRDDLPSNSIIYSLKQDNRRDVFEFLSEELVSALRRMIDLSGKEDDFVITNVPRRRAAIAEYGYDHAEELAKRVGKALGIKYVKVLSSAAKQAQKTTRGLGRLENLKFTYSSKISLSGKYVILIDDIVTTGASMGECAKMLRDIGAKRIYGGCIAIAFKDMYIRPIITYNKS